MARASYHGYFIGFTSVLVAEVALAYPRETLPPL
jgi:hypothetical protein